MAHVDLGEYRFNDLAPLGKWRPTNSAPSFYGFFIISNPPEEWDANGPSIRKRIGLFDRDELSSKLAQIGMGPWAWAWEQDLEPGECIAIGTYTPPAMDWLRFQCTGSDIASAYFTVTQTH